MGKVKLIAALLLIVLTNLFLQLFPHYYAYIKTPVGQVFSGQASWFDPWDINVYVAAVGFGQTGQILLENLYTTTQQPPALIYPLYTLSGLVFRSVDPWLIFYGLVVAMSLILIVVVYLSVLVFLKDKSFSLLATFLITVAGGFGWLVFDSGLISGDTSITGFTFHSALQRPHEALGLSLYLVALVSFYLLTKATRKLKLKIIVSLSLWSLMFFYPYYLLSFIAITAVYLLVIKSTKKHWLDLLSLIILPVVSTIFYYLHLKNTDFLSVTTQNLSNVGLLSSLLGYGLLLPIFFYTAIKYRQNEVVRFVSVWFLVSLVLSQLPLGFARFYLRALFLPLVVQFFFFLSQLRGVQNYLVNLFLINFLVLLPLSSGFIFMRRLQATAESNLWYYQSKQVNEALIFLKNQENSSVLAGYNLGNCMPALTDKKVFFGHFIQTHQALDKYKTLSDFYAGKLNDKQAKAFLSSNKIDWVVYGPEEKQFGQLPNYSFLVSKFINQQVSIFRFAN